MGLKESKIKYAEKFLNETLSWLVMDFGVDRDLKVGIAVLGMVVQPVGAGAGPLPRDGGPQQRSAGSSQPVSGRTTCYPFQ